MVILFLALFINKNYNKKKTMRRKNNNGIVFSFIFLFVLVGLLVFGHVQVNRQERKINDLQETVIENSQNANLIVNFINSSLAGLE